ncbi:Vacuolar protein sorting-associated protein 41-like [Porphyridium purpureum]|uniref:Vacuolar protein sorting-associated protein 41-like n=1 Tax=Porphyridium purpureum TaxID=35688 RepID=A0A5J4YUY3_PORPP|nr:Vacuolar protein sorting-associated protein 41-like [Porphyridium purpureum]|eukprot:POR8827..scf209_3
MQSSELAVSCKPFVRTLGADVQEPEVEQEPTSQSPSSGQSASTFPTALPARCRISCVAAYPSGVLCCGTEAGDIVVLDLHGRIVQQIVGVHRGAVSAIAVQPCRGHTALCMVVSTGWSDGVLKSQSLPVPSSTLGLGAIGRDHHGDTKAFTFTHEIGVSARPTCIAIEPEELASAKDMQRVCFAGLDGRVVIHSRQWWGGQDRILRSGEGPVHALCWEGPLIAWATDQRARVYDIKNDRGVCMVDAPISHDIHMLNAGTIPSHEADSSGSGTFNLPPVQDYDSNRMDELNDIQRAFRPKIVCVPGFTQSSFELYLCWPSAIKLLRLRHSNDGHFRPDLIENFKQSEIGGVNQPLKAASSHSNEQQQQSSLKAAAMFFIDSVPFSSDLLLVLAWNRTTGFVIITLSRSSHAIIYYEQVAFPSKEISRSGLTMLSRRGTEDPCAWSWNCAVSPASKWTAAMWKIETPTPYEKVVWLFTRERYMEAYSIAEHADLFAVDANTGSALASQRRNDAHGAGTGIDAERQPSQETFSLDLLGEKLLEQKRKQSMWDELAILIPRVLQNRARGSSATRETAASSSMRRDFQSSAATATAAATQKAIVPKIRAAWRKWIQVFSSEQKLSLLAEHIPVEDLKLDEREVNQLLERLVLESPQTALMSIKAWPRNLFSLTAIIRFVESERKKAPENARLSSLCTDLYFMSGRHDETMALLLDQGNKDVFRHIRTHVLYEGIVASKEQLAKLFELDLTMTVQLLMQAPSSLITTDDVVAVLETMDNHKWIRAYLLQCFRTNPRESAHLHGRLLELLCEEPSPDLLDFLQTSAHYSLDTALKALNQARIETGAQLHEERVYVLSRMGNLGAAMDILLDELGDVPRAVRFTISNGDPLLYNRLVQCASIDDSVLGVLLSHAMLAQDNLDPLALLQLLRPERQVPALRSRIVCLISEMEQERQLRENCKRLLQNDTELFAQQFEDLTRF